MRSALNKLKRQFITGTPVMGKGPIASASFALCTRRGFEGWRMPFESTSGTRGRRLGPAVTAVASFSHP